jgi:hypothetical protein
MCDDPRRDPRWLRLHSHEWICPCCGLTHAGLFDIGYAKPEHWTGSVEDCRPNWEVRSAKNILTKDFCVIEGEDFFIRCVLELPIVGAPEEQIGFGVWSSLSKDNFDTYVKSFNRGKQGHLGPWFGWFCNHLLGYPETLSLKCRVHPRDGRQRPLIELEPTEHPLAIEQQEGITFDRILELYALSGHDLRTALSG